MASAAIQQDLGVFQKDRESIFSAASQVGPQPRTTVGKYTVLDWASDPRFPYEGKIKQIFYCFSPDASYCPFLISLALRGKSKNEEMQTETAMFERLSHIEGIVKPLLIQEVDSWQYFILELFNEGDLTEYVSKNFAQIPQWQRDWIFCWMADIVEQCHELQVVLRDIKADNILVRRLSNGTLDLKVADLGLALYLPEASLEVRSRIRGTRGYLAPEVFFNKVDQKPPALVNYSTDLWALGVLFFTISKKRMCLHDMEIKRGLHGVRKPKFPAFNEMDFGPLTREVRDLLCLTPEGRPPVAWIAKRASAIYHRTYVGVPISSEMSAPFTIEQLLMMYKQIVTRSGETAFEKITAFLDP